MQITSLIGKQLLSPAGETPGYVLQAFLSRDGKKISCLRCANGDDEEFILPARAILSCSYAIVAGSTRIPSPTGMPAPVMLPVYDQCGESLGTVADYVTATDEPLFVVVKNGIRTEYPLSRALLGDTLVIYPSSAEKRRAAAKRKRNETETDAARAAKPPKQKAPIPPAPVSAAVPPQKELPEREDPNKPTANDYSFNRLNLLGRRVKKSVFDGFGSPVALAGERITPAVISLARRSNRLLELTVNTLTNVL